MTAETTTAETARALEIRLHGRGGQGGVTCAKIIAAVYAELGKSVQTFGDYSGERSGAPVRAYTRVSDEPIQNRNKVYDPHHLLVLDPTLLSDEIVTGLRDGGVLLINTTEPLSAFEGRYPRFRLALVDATGIARRHKIGTRSVVIVNTTIAGAFIHALGLPLSALEVAYAHLGFQSNLKAAEEAFSSVQVREPQLSPADLDGHIFRPGPTAKVMPLIENVEGAPTGLRTGSWRTQLPKYVHNIAPCSAFCPAGNDVIGFVQAATRSAGEAAAVLEKTTPLAGVCGRVCPAPCMAGCNRGEWDGAVNIRGLERWVADQAGDAAQALHAEAGNSMPQEAYEPPIHPSPKKVAIVGGGPAGIAAAYELARAGHRPTIFEGERELGGVLRTGIPTYRLPREVLDREIDGVLGLGVETVLGKFLTKADLESLAESHDAVILATGLQKLRGLDGPGSDLFGVEQGIDFLHRINMVGTAALAGHVVVLGGGNTAMDCARSALRAGASRVTVAYRRSREEMPAIAEEIVEAEHEGVKFVMLKAPVGFQGDSRVQGVILADVELGPPDDSGRRRPVVTKKTSVLPCDTVLLALGQSADTSFLPDGWELRKGQIYRTETHHMPSSAFGDLESSVPGEGEPQPISVFAAGDLSTGDGTVTHAIGDGRRAANRVMRLLGDDIPELVRPDRSKAVPVTDIRLDHFVTSPPMQERLLPASDRVHHSDEVSLGLASGLEAHRCFSCGECTQCDTCLIYCPEGIIRRKDLAYAVDYTYCKGCGICVTECPRKAMEMSAS